MNNAFVWITLASEALLILICLHTAFGQRLSFDKSTVGMFGVMCVTYWLMNEGILPKMCTVVIYLVTFVYCYWKFHLSVGKAVIRFFVGFTIVGLIEAIVVNIAILLLSIGEENKLMVFASAISLCVAWIGSKIIEKRKFLFSLRFPNGLLVDTVLFGAAFGGLLVDYYINGAPVNLYITVIMILMWLEYIYSYILEQSKQEVLKKNLELELQKVYGGVYAELTDQVRQRQHDFKNQLGAIYSMHLTAQSLDELIEMQQAYGNQLREDSKFDSILLCCENSILTGYIYYRCLMCQKMGIQVTYQIQLGEVKCCFAIHEIIEILGILIDNAAEYEENSGESGKDKRIHLRFKEDEDVVTFSVSNPAGYITSSEIERMFKKGYSTKGKNRGIGLARVLEMVRQHGTEIMVQNNMLEGVNWIDFSFIASKRNG